MKKTKKIKIKAATKPTKPTKQLRKCVRCGADGFNSRTCGGTVKSHQK